MSREAKATVFWLLVIALTAGAAWLLWKPPPTPQRSGAQEVTVNFLLDGDSLEVSAAAPGPVIPVTTPVQLRLVGIDAPEMHGPDGRPQCWAEQAKAELSRLAPPGGSLWLASDTQPRDAYGRYLVFAWTADGTPVNQRLAEIGAVKPLFIEYHPELTASFDAARSAGRGLWGRCTGEK